MAYSGKQSFSGSYAIRDLWTYMLRFIVDSGYWSIVHSDFSSSGTGSYPMSDDISVTALDTWLDLSSTDAYSETLTESITGESVGTGDGTTTSFSHTASHTPIPNPGSPIALYKFDGNADDSMGNYNGTATDVTYSTGKFGQAVSCTGDSQSVDLSYLIPTSQDYAIALWVKASSDGVILVNGRSGEAYSTIEISTQKVSVSKLNSVATGASTTLSEIDFPSLADNNWHFISVTKNGLDIKVHIDSNNVYSDILSENCGDSNYSVGLFDIDTNHNEMLGSVDQLYIFNKALTDVEVQALYKNSSIQLSYTIGGTVYSGQDDLSGNITGTDLSGTVDYSTGAIDLTYTTAPDDTTAITMDYSYDLVAGTDYEINNNLGRVKFLSSGQVQVNDTVHADYTWKREYIIFYSTGISGTEKIYIGAMPYINSDGVHGYVQWKAYKYWQEGMTFTDTTLGTTYNSFGFALWNSDTDLWMFVNKQRVIAVGKIQNYYNSVYVGFFNRFAMPHEYNYPLCVITSDDIGMSYSSQSYRYFIPNSWRINFMTNDNTWHYYYRFDYERSDYNGIYNGNGHYGPGVLLPMQQDASYLVEMHYPTGANRALLPIYIWADKDSDNHNYSIYGQLDGVYFSPASINSSESEVTVGADTYIIFQDVYRTGWSQFMAVKED